MYQKQTPLLSSFAFPFRNLIAHRSELTDNHRWSFSFTKLGLLRSFSVRWESFRVYFSFLILFSSLGYFIIVESSILSPSTLFASILSDTIRYHGFPCSLPRYSSHPVTPLPLSLQSYRFHLSSTSDPFLSWPQQLYRAMFGIPVRASQDSFNEFGTTMYAWLGHTSHASRLFAPCLFQALSRNWMALVAVHSMCVTQARPSVSFKKVSLADLTFFGPWTNPFRLSSNPFGPAQSYLQPLGPLAADLMESRCCTS